MNQSERQRRAERANERGNAHFRENRFPHAIEAYTQAITLDPKCPIYFLNRCITYSRMSQRDFSIADAARVLKLDLFQAKAYIYIAKAYFEIGFTNKAEYCLSTAKKLDHNVGGIEEENSKVKMMQDDLKTLMDLVKKKDCAGAAEYLLKFYRNGSQMSLPLLTRKLVEEVCRNDMVDERKSIAQTLAIFQGEETLYLLAICAYYEDDEKAVHENFTNYLKFVPQNYHGKKRYESMKEIYQMRRKGDEAFTKRRYHDAQSFYFKALELNNQFYCGRLLTAKLYYKIAKTQLQLNKKDEAINHLNLALSFKEDYHEALAMKGESLVSLGQSEGLKDLEKALSIYPSEDYLAIFQKAKQKFPSFQAKKPDMPDTESSLERDLKISKMMADSKKSAGNELYKAGNFMGAIDAYSEAIEMDPKNAIYFANRSACHLALKNFKDALEDAKIALGFDSLYVKAILRLGKAQIALGQLEEAIKTYKRASYKLPMVNEINTELEKTNIIKSIIDEGNSSMSNKDFLNAERHFLSAMELERDCMLFQVKRIQCLYHMRKFDEVTSAIESALLLNKEEPTLYYFKGLCSYQKGDKDEAISHLKKSLSLDITQTNVSEALKMVRSVFKLRERATMALNENKLDEALTHYFEGLKEDSEHKAFSALFYLNVGLIHQKKKKKNGNWLSNLFPPL